MDIKIWLISWSLCIPRSSSSLRRVYRHPPPSAFSFYQEQRDEPVRLVSPPAGPFLDFAEPCKPLHSTFQRYPITVRQRWQVLRRASHTTTREGKKKKYLLFASYFLTLFPPRDRRQTYILLKFIQLTLINLSRYD